MAIPEAALAAASGTFEPAGVVGDLPTTCVLSLGAAGMTAAYAVLPGGAATLTAVAANATAAGAEVSEAGGMFTATVDGATVIGTSFTALTQETAGFESVDDLVVIVSTSALG